MERLVMTGEATVTWGSFCSTPVNCTEMGAPLTPLRNVAFPGRTVRSAPMPLFIRFCPVSCPIMMAMMVNIITTSMATAKTLMRERSGRWSRLARISLFIVERGSQGGQNAAQTLVLQGTAWDGRIGEQERPENGDF